MFHDELTNSLAAQTSFIHRKIPIPFSACVLVIFTRRYASAALDALVAFAGDAHAFYEKLRRFIITKAKVEAHGFSTTAHPALSAMAQQSPVSTYASISHSST